jgi:mono/diheme cytochrome c family protein
MNEEKNENYGGWSWLMGGLAGVAIIAMLVAAYSIGYSRGEDTGGDGRAAARPDRPQDERAAPSRAAGGPGKQLFAQTCGSCHTLSAAGTSGNVGPSLDQLEPDQARVLSAIENGGTGSGAMPKGLLKGKQAEQVADFVAATAGR